MRTLVAFAVFASTNGFVGIADALEKVSRRDTEPGPDHEAWSAGFPTCAIVYYNRCTGWSWGWSDFGEGDRFGVCADNCCLPDHGAITTTRLRVFTGAPSGYGFTGTVGLETVDANCCPSGVIAAHPWLPTGPFDEQAFWNLMPLEFAIVYTIAGANNPATIVTDHPAARGDDPPACGFCYPTDRTNHSFLWGSAASPNCPGSTFYDGVCDAQLRVDIFGVCPSPVADESWGRLKALFR